jgi:hypothetical protein
LTATIVWFHRGRYPGWEYFLLANLLGSAAVMMPRGLQVDRLPGAIRFLRDFYPLLLFPLRYKELEQFAPGVWRLEADGGDSRPGVIVARR